ncbi:hypothetical protein [Achromobacter xylosoxidans]|uniref:hypothetical protein n=1 Tax=Alcaligenes xylosoxydans xylosoxydans TaxID=85698 RepID=UPI0012DF7FCA|nr:hypothetical protein [Achromobacter xylosoxidans]
MRSIKHSTIVVAVIVATAASASGLLWLAVTYRHLIFWAATFGGSFGGGISVSALGILAGAWSLFTVRRLDTGTHPRAINWITVGGKVALGLAILAQIGILWLWINGEFGKITDAEVFALALTLTCSVMIQIYRWHTA